MVTRSLQGHYVRFSFMNGSSFEPMLGSYWLRVLRGCVLDSVSPRFEFSFMNGSSFEPMPDHFGRICYAVAFQIRFHSRFEFRFMNGSSFEPILGSFWSHKTWLRSRFGFMKSQPYSWLDPEMGFESGLDMLGLTQLLCLLQDRNRKAKFDKLVNVRSSSMLERYDISEH